MPIERIRRSRFGKTVRLNNDEICWNYLKITTKEALLFTHAANIIYQRISQSELQMVSKVQKKSAQLPYECHITPCTFLHLESLNKYLIL